MAFLFVLLMSSQDVLAHAVAEEMQKVYQNELGPQPVPLTVLSKVIDEEEVSLFFSLSLLSTRSPLCLKEWGSHWDFFVHIPYFPWTWVL